MTHHCSMWHHIEQIFRILWFLQKFLQGRASTFAQYGTSRENSFLKKTPYTLSSQHLTHNITSMNTTLQLIHLKWPRQWKEHLHIQDEFETKRQQIISITRSTVLNDGWSEDRPKVQQADRASLAEGGTSVSEVDIPAPPCFFSYTSSSSSSFLSQPPYCANTSCKQLGRGCAELTYKLYMRRDAEQQR